MDDETMGLAAQLLNSEVVNFDQTDIDNARTEEERFTGTLDDGGLDLDDLEDLFAETTQSVESFSTEVNNIQVQEEKKKEEEHENFVNVLTSENNNITENTSYVTVDNLENDYNILQEEKAEKERQEFEEYVNVLTTENDKVANTTFMTTVDKLENDYLDLKEQHEEFLRQEAIKEEIAKRERVDALDNKTSYNQTYSEDIDNIVKDTNNFVIGDEKSELVVTDNIQPVVKQSTETVTDITNEDYLNDLVQGLDFSELESPSINLEKTIKTEETNFADNVARYSYESKEDAEIQRTNTKEGNLVEADTQGMADALSIGPTLAQQVSQLKGKAELGLLIQELSKPIPVMDIRDRSHEIEAVAQGTKDIVDRITKRTDEFIAKFPELLEHETATTLELSLEEPMNIGEIFASMDNIRSEIRKHLSAEGGKATKALNTLLLKEKDKVNEIQDKLNEKETELQEVKDSLQKAEEARQEQIKTQEELDEVKSQLKEMQDKLVSEQEKAKELVESEKDKALQTAEEEFKKQNEELRDKITSLEEKLEEKINESNEKYKLEAQINQLEKTIKKYEEESEEKKNKIATLEKMVKDNKPEVIANETILAKIPSRPRPITEQPHAINESKSDKPSTPTKRPGLMIPGGELNTPLPSKSVTPIIPTINSSTPGLKAIVPDLNVDLDDNLTADIDTEEDTVSVKVDGIEGIDSIELDIDEEEDEYSDTSYTVEDVAEANELIERVYKECTAYDEVTEILGDLEEFVGTGMIKSFFPAKPEKKITLENLFENPNTDPADKLELTAQAFQLLYNEILKPDGHNYVEISEEMADGICTDQDVDIMYKHNKYYLRFLEIPDNLSQARTLHLIKIVSNINKQLENNKDKNSFVINITSEEGLPLLTEDERETTMTYLQKDYGVVFETPSAIGLQRLEPEDE